MIVFGFFFFGSPFILAFLSSFIFFHLAFSGPTGNNGIFTGVRIATTRTMVGRNGEGGEGGREGGRERGRRKEKAKEREGIGRGNQPWSFAPQCAFHSVQSDAGISQT